MRAFVRVLVLLALVSLAMLLAAAWTPTHGSNGPAGIELLLTVIIAISGVTAPVIIVFRSEGRNEIRNVISETIETCLGEHGFTVDSFVSAYCEIVGFAEAKAGTGDAARSMNWRSMIGRAPPLDQHKDKGILLALGRAYHARYAYDHDDRRYLGFPDDARVWICGDSKFRQWTFQQLFDYYEDRTTSVWLLYALGPVDKPEPDFD